ncbi:MAG: hypothetical protein HN729_05055 [Candidatus Marinimicrobia bacterium]|nr:hypothetical protein [Candidatus Neomarinimicrobiota bacterium]MBT3634592.1 hypothetical protein [Candidatus Neomarinimicrobiota bacterium]MBT3683327.1 hypothetical protein [Candidatus Neomarinimicrobiota bacterium]MBT3760246.1 hypothetical protein [Candidatus Neomarinimicrobiota bacterium]MBT3896341.1 hypothetical protein [Candidatus Neomarinimicrobiota bacterium]
MIQSDKISDYLRKRGIKGPWKIHSAPDKKFDYILIVPVISESKNIPNLLLSISNQVSVDLENIMVIIVINNGENPDVNIYQDNCNLRFYLDKETFPFHLTYVDAFTPGYQLSEKLIGVGMARKIGTDLSLQMVSKNGLLFHTDGDCYLSPNYFSNIIRDFHQHQWAASVVGFKHQKSSIPRIENAIRNYENMLITTADKMRQAGSIYGYPAIGSAMICTPLAYVSVSGMPKRKATEDFYFLQEIAKYREVSWNDEILVHPSPRAEQRVHLGTGFRMSQVVNGFEIQTLEYSEIAFRILHDWIRLAADNYKTDIKDLILKCKIIHEDFPKFIISLQIEAVWDGINHSAPTSGHFALQFQRWFDGLKSIHLLRNFSDNY